MALTNRIFLLVALLLLSPDRGFWGGVRPLQGAKVPRHPGKRKKREKRRREDSVVSREHFIRESVLV